jgi:hypothetical protein
MTAQLVAFETRADVGLKPARSVSHNVHPERGGVTLHYGGPAVRLNGHETCRALWREWQAFHMGPSRGWADVAYTGAYCNHGIALAGRGYGVRTAAQGTDDGNNRHLAVVWLGGKGQVPSRQALDAAEWWVMTLRAAGAGDEVKAHGDWHSTDCPGPYLTTLARQLDGRVVLPPSKVAGTSTPPPVEHPELPGHQHARAVLRRGDVGHPDPVRDWTGHLNAWRLNRRGPDGAPLSTHEVESGVFDGWVDVATRTFEAAYGRVPTGIVTADLWALMHTISKGTRKRPDGSTW